MLPHILMHGGLRLVEPTARRGGYGALVPAMLVQGKHERKRNTVLPQKRKDLLVPNIYSCIPRIFFRCQSSLKGFGIEVRGDSAGNDRHRGLGNPSS